MTKRKFEYTWKHVVTAGLLGNIAIIGYHNQEPIRHNLSAAIPDDALDNQVSHIASDLTNHNVRVDCSDNMPDNSRAYVATFNIPRSRIAPPVMTIDQNICEDLLTITDPNNASLKEYTYDGIRSVLTVLHEDEHIRQVRNEAEADCYAMQKLSGALEDTLYVDAEVGEEYAQNVVNRVAGERSIKYRSNECRPGGDYDLGIGSVYPPIVPTGTPPEEAIPNY